MAEEKKTEINYLEEITFLLAGILIIGVIIGRFAAITQSTGVTSLGAIWQAVLNFFVWFWPIWKVIVIVLTIGSIVWTTYSLSKLKEVEEKERKIYGAIPEDINLLGETIKEKENAKWLKVLELSHSANLSDWRLAVIEADVMLEEVLRAAGYAGDGVGEMLKSVDHTDMLTLDSAWEGHKIRNRIAHNGGAYQLTERETRRVISLFESVFKELQII